MDAILLSPDQAARVLSASRSRVYEWIASGELESIKLGASRRIPTKALQDFVERQRRAQGESVLTQ